MPRKVDKNQNDGRHKRRTRDMKATVKQDQPPQALIHQTLKKYMPNIAITNDAYPGLRLNRESLVKIKLALALIKAGYTVKESCDQLELGRGTFYTWVQYSEENKKLINEIYDTRCTVVEDALYEQCIKGNIRAIEFFLKFRSERYKERTNPLVSINFDLDKKREDIKRRFGLDDILDADFSEVK